MPEIVFPTSDIGRLALLNRIYRIATGQLAVGAEQNELAAFLQTLTGEVGDFLAVYRPTITAVQDTLGKRMEETEERRQAIDWLNMLVRDFLVVLKRRMRRNGEPAKLWRTYGIQSDGALPTPRWTMCPTPTLPITGRKRLPRTCRTWTRTN